MFRSFPAFCLSALAAIAFFSPIAHAQQSRQRPELTLPNLSCGPAPCIFTNVQVSFGRGGAESSVIAVNPNNPAEMLVTGEVYNCAALLGVFSSEDGGASWSHNCLPLLTGGEGIGGPIAAYDSNGTAYAGGVAAPVQNGWMTALVWKSTDNGRTWTAPAEVTKNVDEPWLEVDRSATSPFKGSLYLSASHLAIGHHANLYDITVSHSQDGGNTWTTTTVNRSSGITVTGLSHLAIDKDGTVFVTWLSCKVTGSEGDATCGGTRATFWISSSSDGGNIWSPPRAVATALMAPDLFAYTEYGLLPNTHTSIPVLNIPVVAVDNSSAPSSGRLYVTFYNYNGRHLQVGVTTSKDGGFTWSPATRASEVNMGDQYAPWISVADDGTVGVSWLDRRADSFDYQPVFATSRDEGVTFSSAFALSGELSNPDLNAPNFAYYRTHQWIGNTLYATWIDTRTGQSQVEIGGVQF